MSLFQADSHAVRQATTSLPTARICGTTRPPVGYNFPKRPAPVVPIPLPLSWRHPPMSLPYLYCRRSCWLALLIAALGCGKADQIRSYTVDKEPPVADTKPAGEVASATWE